MIDTTATKRAFTLIELLVAISIIAILAGLILVNFVGTRERAADAQKKSDLNQIKKALQLYYNDEQRYPYRARVVGSTFEENGNVYMEELPSFTYQYYTANTGNIRTTRQEYLLHTELDRDGDPDAASSVSKCDPTSRSYYDGPTPDGNDYYVCND